MQAPLTKVITISKSAERFMVLPFRAAAARRCADDTNKLLGGRLEHMVMRQRDYRTLRNRASCASAGSPTATKIL